MPSETPEEMTSDHQKQSQVGTVLLHLLADIGEEVVELVLTCADTRTVRTHGGPRLRRLVHFHVNGQLYRSYLEDGPNIGYQTGVYFEREIRDRAELLARCLSGSAITVAVDNLKTKT